MKGAFTPIVLCVLLGGCAVSPSINVLGAFFPDWMFCISGAVVLVVVARLVARAVGRAATRSGGPLAYGALAVVVALTGWLVFFEN
jgi:hypothetical protein